MRERERERFLRRGSLPRPLAPATLAALCFRLFARVSALLPLRSLSPLPLAVAWLRCALRILTPAPGRSGTGFVDEEEGPSFPATRKTDEAFCWLAVCTHAFGCENACLPSRADGVTPPVDSIVRRLLHVVQ